jgi:predicted exporter
MLWIGAVGDSQSKKYYSAVFPLHVTENFDARQMAKNLPHVYAVNKMQNINASLTKISRISLTLVGLAYIVMFIILVVVYKFTDALRILRAPILASFFVASAFGYLNMEFNFFAIVGVILTLGIGIDYALFFREGGRQKSVTTLAIMLSAATTLISFGSLVCSAFIPVKTFGLAVLLGILCCFLLSPLSAKR